MRKTTLILLTGLLTFLTACRNKGENAYIPSVGGIAYDLMIVGNANIWKDTAGRKIFETFDQEMPGLPQSEPMFNILFLETQNFTDIVKPMRNLFFFHVDSTQYTQGKVSFSKNRWANTQAIVKITAPTQEEFIKALNEKSQAIIDFYVDQECERNILYFDRYREPNMIKLMNDSLDIDLKIPNYINKSKTAKNFVWISNGSIDARLDILAYRTPHTDSTDFTMKRILEKRDSITKLYIPGPSEGSYMTTEREVIPPVDRHFYFKKKKCTEVRGLWRTEGDFMGGPFVSRTFYDPRTDEMLTVEAFVYAPQHKKRNKIRQVEAVLHSLDFE